MAELDISGNSIQLDCSVDSGICVEGVTKDLKKKIQEFKRILFILERDKEAMRLLRERLSRIAERKIVKKKKDGQSVCNVCFTQIDTDDSKTCVVCYSCAKNVCRGEKCSEWVPHDGEWRCQLCAAQRDSYGKASTWVKEQQAVKRASLTECSYPMRARSEIYIPLCDPNESAFLCNFESVSEVASPINPNQKQHIREYIEEVLAEMIGGSLENSTVEQISTNKDYQQVRNGHELQGVSNVRLRRLIESIIAETIRQPPFASAGLITTTSAIESSDIDHDHGGESLPLNGNANHCNGNGGQYFESKQYHDLLATAVLNRIVNTHGNGRLSESSPDLTSSSILDSNHNAINLNKTDESVSSSSSVEPRSESSLTDPIRSINKDEDGNFGSFYHDDVANDNIEADRESVLSDFISSHMVPLPHISAEPASEEDEDEEDYISVASSRDANWEDNWLFKKKKSNKTSSSSVGMLVPAPKEDIRALIGDKPTDEVSDLSEIGSDTDDSSLEMISASLEPLNDRLVNKHLIGGKNTKIVLDELVDRTSMISTSSLPDNEPPYTETKNEFVVSNDGLNESQSLKISVNICNKAISNEAINSNVTKAISAKVEKLTKEGQVTEDESIVPPPNDFTDDEKMRNLLAKFNEEQHNKTDSGDDNSSSMSPRSSISCALSAGIERAQLDAYEGITDFSVEDEEGPASEIDPEMAESSSRRPSVIEILAAIALGPMLAVSASDDRNILTELELSSLMELNELAMAQMSAKTNEERRLGVIAEESFDIGPGDDHRIESIECNEEADLLSSPKMVMDAIRELVGKDLMRSEQSEESSIQIEEITDDSIITEEIGQQNILNDPAESIKNSAQTNQEQLQIEESFEIVPVQHELKEGTMQIGTLRQCQTEAEEEMQQGQSETKMADSELGQAHIHVIKSNDDDNGITMNILSEDFGFEKVIPDDTSSISDESLHTIGSSSEYSEDLDGDTTSFFVDEHKISVIAEMSTEQKLQEKIAENQSSESDKTVNEFILPPPTAFCDKESRKHDEDGGGSEKDQMIEAHINSETIQDINQITSENSDNEIEKTATDEETHNEKPCTETEVIENTKSIPKIEIVEISTSETNKSDEPPDKEALDETLPKNEADLVSSIETVQSESIIDSEIENETKCKQNLVEISQEKVVTNIDELTEEKLQEKSEKIIVEQTAPTVTNEPAALKTLSEAQLALLELNYKVLNVEESIVPINSQQITGKAFKDSQEVEEIKDVSTPEVLPHEKQTNEQHVNNQANEISEETSSIPANESSEVQPIEESANEQNIILKYEIIDTVSESLNNNSASEVIDLVELKHQETSEKQSEEQIFEQTIQENATETTTTEDIRVSVDDISKTEIEENPEPEDLSSEIKSSEPTENLKTEETEFKIVEEKGNDVIVEEIVPLIETSPDSQNIGEQYTNSSSQANSESEPKIEDSLVGDNLVPEKSSEVFSKQLLEEVENAFKSQSNKQDTEEDEQLQKKLISQEQEAFDEEIANTLDSDTKLLATNVEEPISSDRKEDSEKTSSETIKNEKKPANEETPIQTESSNPEELQTADIDETKDQNEDEQASILDPTDGGNINGIESFPNDTLNDTTNLEDNPDSHIQTIDAVVTEGSQSEITLTVQALLEPSNEEPSETNAIQILESHKAEDVNNISHNDSKASDKSSETSIEDKPNESQILLLNQDDTIDVTDNAELESTQSKELITGDLSDTEAAEKERKKTSEIRNLQAKLHTINVDEFNLNTEEPNCEETLLPIQEKEVLNMALTDATNNNLEDQQSQNIQITDNKTDDKQVEIENSNLTDHENITKNITSNEENPDNQIQEKSAVEAGTDLLSTPSNEEVKKAEKGKNIAEKSLEVSTTSITKKSDSLTEEANDEDANDLKEEHQIEISENLKVEEEQIQQTEIGGVKKPLDDIESQLKSETTTSSQISCTEKVKGISTVNVSDPESMNTGIVQGETKEKEETPGELKDKLVEEIKESLCNDMQIESVDVEQLEKDAKEVVNDFNASNLEALPSNDEQDLAEPNAEKSMLDNDDISTEPIKMESVADTASTEEQCVFLSTEEKVQKIESSETNNGQIQAQVVTTDTKTEISTQTIACEDPTIEPADLKSDTVSSVEGSVTDLKIEGPVPMPTGNNEETDATSASGSKFEVKVEAPEENALTGENKESSAADVVAKETKAQHIQIEVVTEGSKTEVSTQTNACEDPTIEPVDLKSDTVLSVEIIVTDRKIEEPVTMPKDYNKELDATSASSSEVEAKVKLSEENALTGENKESSTADVVTNETKFHIQKADLDSNHQISELENLQINSEVQSKIKNSESTEKPTEQKTVEKSTCTDPETVEPEIEIPEIKKSQIEEADKEENTSKPNDQTLILEDSSPTEISSDEKESQETKQINTELEQAKETLKTEESNCNTGTFISEKTIPTEDISERKKNQTVRQDAIEEQPENNSTESKVEDNLQTTDDCGIQTLTSEESIAAKDLSGEQGSQESKQIHTQSDEDFERNAEHQEEGIFIPVDEPKEELPENKSDETVSTDEISGREELTKVEGIIKVIDKFNQESGQICQEPGLHKDLQVQEEIRNADEKVVGENKTKKSKAHNSEETEAKVVALDAPVEEPTSLSSEDTSLLNKGIKKQGELVSESTSSAENTEEVLKENENINKTVLVEENAEESICEVAHEIRLEEICTVEDTSNQSDTPILKPDVESLNKEVEVETQNCVLVDDLTLSTDDEKIRSILSESALTLKTDDEKIEDILVVKSKFTKEETGDQTAEEEISLNTQEPVPDNKDLSVLLERVDETATILLDAIQKEVNSEIETTLSSETESQTAIESNEDKVVQNGVDAEKIVKNETESNIISDSEMITSHETVPKIPTESLEDINVENEVRPNEEVTLSNETESQITTENVEDKAVQNDDRPDASTTVSNEIEIGVSIQIFEDKEVPKEIISESETIISNETESEIKVEYVEDKTDERRPDTESILSNETRDKAVKFESSNAETLSSNDTETEVTTENVEDKTTQDEVRPETESQTNIEKVKDQDVQNESSPDTRTTVLNEIESGVSIQIVEEKEDPKEIISEAETIISNETESEIKVENVEDKTDEIRPDTESILSNETRDKAVKFESSNAETLSSNDTETEVTTENVEDKTTQDEVRPETESQTNIEKVKDQDVQNESSPNTRTTVLNEIESGVSIQIVEEKEDPKEIISEAETIISNETESEIKVENVEDKTDEIRPDTESILSNETRDKAVKFESSNAETLSSNDTETEVTTENVEDNTTQDEVRPETESQTNIEKVKDQDVQNESSPDTRTTVLNEIESGVSIQIVEEKEDPKEIISEAETIISNETESEIKVENVEDKTDEIRPDTESILSNETRDKAVKFESSNAETLSSNDTETEVTTENVEDKTTQDEVQPETESQTNIEKVRDHDEQNEGSPDASTTVSNEIESGVSIQIVEKKKDPKEIISEAETIISNETESEIKVENVEDKTDEIRPDTESILSNETRDKAVKFESSNAETLLSNDTETEVTTENVEDKTTQDEVRPETESQTNIEKVKDQDVQNEGSPDTSTTVSNEIESGVSIQIVEDREVPKEIITEAEMNISNKTESEVKDENVEDKTVQDEISPETESILSSETRDKAVQNESSNAETVSSNDNETEVTKENVEDKSIKDEVQPETESQINIEKVEDQVGQNEGSPDASTTVSNEIESGVSIQIVEDKEVPKEIITEAEMNILNKTESEVTEENVEDEVRLDTETTLSSETGDKAVQNESSNAETVSSNNIESEVIIENIDDKTIQGEVRSNTENGTQPYSENVEDQAVQNQDTIDTKATESDVTIKQFEDKVVQKEIILDPETIIPNETESEVTEENVEVKAVQGDVRPNAETTLSTEDKPSQIENPTAEAALSNDNESEVATENVEDKTIQHEIPPETESLINIEKVEDQAVQNENSPDARMTVTNESISDVSNEQVENKVVRIEINSEPETTISNETESKVTSNENVENKAVQNDVRPDIETTLSSKTNDKAFPNESPNAETTISNDTESEVTTENIEDRAIQDEVIPATEPQIHSKKVVDQAIQNENSPDARTTVSNESVNIDQVEDKIVPKEIISKTTETTLSNKTDSEVTSEENVEDKAVQDDVRLNTETTFSSKAEDKALQNEGPSAETTLSNDTKSEVITENLKDKAIQDEVPPESESQIPTKEVEDHATQNENSPDARTMFLKESESDVNIEEVREKVIPKEIISKPETTISNATESEVTSEENNENKAVQDEVQPETETILLSKTESQITTENAEDKSVQDEVRPDAATTLLSESTSEVPTENVEDKAFQAEVLPDSETTLLSETISQIPTETDVEMTVSNETKFVITAVNVEDKTEFEVTTENVKDKVVLKEIISDPENIISSETVPKISIESVEIKAEHDELIPDVKTTVTNETDDKTVQSQVSPDVETVVLSETESEVITENVEDKNEYEATVENSEDKTVENEIRTDAQTTISSPIESEIPTENVEDKAVQEDSPDVETVLANKIEHENTAILKKMISEPETKISNETVPEIPPENVESEIGSDQAHPDSETTLPSENEIEVTTERVEEEKVQKEIISEPETIISNETLPRIPIENVDDKTILNEESPGAETTLSSETESKILIENIQDTKVSNELNSDGETTVLSETASRIGTDNVEVETVQNEVNLETETMILNTTESNMSTDKIENIIFQEEVSPDAETIISNESESQKPTAIQEESSNIEKVSTNNKIQVENNIELISTDYSKMNEDLVIASSKDDVESSKPKESLSEVTQLISEIVQSDTTIEALDSEPEISKDDLESKDSSVSIEEKQDYLENAEVPLSEKDAEVSQTNNLEKLEETQSETCVENLTENIGIQCFEKEAESKDTKEQDSKADNLKADIIPKEQIVTTATNQVTNEFQSLDVINSEDTRHTLERRVSKTKESEIPDVIISTTEIIVVEETNEIFTMDHRNDATNSTTQGEMKLDLENIIVTETETDKASLKEEAEITESDVKNYEKLETEDFSTALQNQVSDKASSENIKENSKLLNTTAEAVADADADNRENLCADIFESQKMQAEVIEVQNEPVQSSETVSENELNEEPLLSASFSISEEISAEEKFYTKEEQENEPIIEEDSEVTEASKTDKLNTPTKTIEETNLTLQSQELNTDSKIDSFPDVYDISETNSEDSFQSAVGDVEIISDLKKSTSISEITLKASEAVILKELPEVCGIPKEIANIELSIVTKNETEQKTAVSLSKIEPNKESNISETETTEGSLNTLDLQKSDIIVTGAIALAEFKDIEKTSSIEETNITEAVSKVEGNQVKAEEIQNQETSLSEIELVSDGTESLFSKQTDNLVGDVENVTVHSNSKLDPKDLTRVPEEKPEPKAQEVPEVVIAAEPNVPEAVVSEPENQVHNDSVEDLPTQIPLLESKDASMLSESEISIKKEESVSKEGFSISHEKIAEEVSGPIPNLSKELTITKDLTASSNDKPNSSIVEEVQNKSTTQGTIAENSEVVILGIPDGKNRGEDSVSKEELSVSHEKISEDLSTLLTITQDAPVITNGKPNEEVPNKSITEALIAENSEVDTLEISDGTTNTIKDTKVSEETIVVSIPQESVLDSKERFEVIEEIKSKEITADPSKSLETTNDIEAVAAMDTQNKPLEGEIVAEIISETEILQEESNKVSAKAEKIENTIPIKNSDEAQTSAEVISITEKPERVKSDAPNENIQIQKTFGKSEEQSLKSISGDIAMEDKLSETMTEQVAEVVEIPPIEVLTATCKIITHPPLQKTESLIESAQCLYDEISHQVLETSPEINTPTLAEELRMAADRNDKKSSKSERVIPQSIACESRCFTPEPQPDESIASDSVVATEQPNAQDAAQGNQISQVAKQLIFAEQSAKKSKAKHSGSSKFRNLTLRDRRFLAELEKRRKQRELIQNYLDSLDCTDTQSYLNEDLYLFESKCSIERSPYSLFIEPSDYCIVGATSPSPIANTHFLNTNILFSDRISSESNCTDDSTTTVIDTFGSMEFRSNSDSSGEEFSPDDSTDRDSSATATTANNSILTTTNKATNQSHIYSPPPPLPLQPQPELRTESACSKLLQTRTSTGGNEEHVDDDPLKHLVPGSIAEREYKKWYNAVDMPNNPYSVEALRRRLSGGLDRTLDLPNISPCNEDNPLQLSESPAPEAETKGQERDYSRYSRDYYINDAKQASGTTKKSPTSPPQVSSPTSTASSIELDERVKHNSQTVETTPVKEMCHKLEKQCRIEADIYLATPVQVIEDIDVPQAFADKKPIQTVGRTITTSLTTEAVSRLSSDTSSILTNESLTPSEDSDTIRIYDLKKQETRLVKETTQTTTITVPKSPEKKVRPTELDIMPTLAPPIATVSAKCSTPTSFKFLQPKRKLINPSQVLSIDQDSTPLTPSTPDKTVIEAEVIHAMPSVKALAKAFLMTSSTSSSDNKWRKARAKTPMQFFKPTTPTATAAAAGTAAVANINRGIQKQPESVIPDTTSQGSEDATIASDLSSLETDPPSRIDGDTLDEDRVVLSGCLRNNIAFFENLKNK